MNNTNSRYEKDFAHRFNGVELTPELSIPADANVAARRDMLTRRTSAIGADFIDNLPSDMNGIQERRVKRYVQDQGLSVADYIVFDERNTDVFDDIAVSHGLSRYPDDGSSYDYGMTDPALGISFVRRDSDMEQKYGPVFSEAVLVHELVHGSSRWNEWTMVNDGNRVSHTNKRLGFQVLKSADMKHPGQERNAFFEEGFAAMITSDYLRESGQELPFKMHADIAGDGLTMLCQTIPELRQAMINGRKGVDGLRETARLINDFSPGLYAKLGALEYGVQDFDHAVRLIKTAL